MYGVPSVISRALRFSLFFFFSDGSSTSKYKRKRELQDFILQASPSNSDPAKTRTINRNHCKGPDYAHSYYHMVVCCTFCKPALSNDSLNKPFLLRTKQKFTRFLLRGVDGYVVANRPFWFCDLFMF